MSPVAADTVLSARALLRWQFGLAHDFLEAVIERCSAETLHRRPPGMATSAGACYAQAVLCEDLSVNGVLSVGTPLAFSIWAGRTGLSELPPPSCPLDWHAWAGRVRLDLATLRSYAQAVYAATDASLAALPDDAFDLVRGERPASLLSALLLTLSMRRGEIACVLALEHRPSATEW